VPITEAGGSSDQGVNLLGKLGSRDRPHSPVALASPDVPALPPDQRSWIGLVVQSGVASFVAWLQRWEAASELPAGVFAEAPRELASPR
jgi:hypothetical protein